MVVVYHRGVSTDGQKTLNLAVVPPIPCHDVGLPMNHMEPAAAAETERATIGEWVLYGAYRSYESYEETNPPYSHLISCEIPNHRCSRCSGVYFHLLSNPSLPAVDSEGGKFTQRLNEHWCLNCNTSKSKR
jgi:hypothetical protein